jgi:hypothetical protein
MGKDDINWVYKFLNVAGVKKTINDTNLLILVFGTLACYANNVYLEVIPCFIVILWCLAIWGENCENSLFVYSGAQAFLLSLCFLLIELGYSKVYFGFKTLVVLILFNIPIGAYFARHTIRKNTDQSNNSSKEVNVSIIGFFVVITGIIEREILSIDARIFLLIIFCNILFCIAIAGTIIDFYKDFIRKKYNVDIKSLMKQQHTISSKKK